MKIFFDTWAWLTLRDKREAMHYEALEAYNKIKKSGCTIITSDYVLDETYTLLFARLHFKQASESMELLDESIKRGYLQLEWITPYRFREVQKLRLKYHDKPKISFTDLSTVVIMDELGIRNIFTNDAHFTHIGMDFLLSP